MPPDIKLEHPPITNNEDLDAPRVQPTKVCHACGATGVKNRCGACRQVYFCNRECQKAIWIAHRPECQRFVATASNEASNTPSESNEASNAPRRSNVTKGATNASTVSASTDDGSIQADVASKKAAPSSTSAPPSPPKKKAVVLLPVPEVLTVLPPAEDEHDACVPSSAPKSSKKKKHKKKKARSNSLHAPASAPMATTKLKSRSQSLSAKKHIVWGDVWAREFTRFPGGGSTVPYDGSWALGLGSPVADVQLGSVLDVEELRLSVLEARAKDLTKSQRAKVRDGETRQFDYKSGVRNPLFGRLTERERRKLFSESELIHLHELEEQVAHRKRSMSSETQEEQHHEELDADFACVASEQLNEFAVIRDSRDDACGCSCGELLKKVAKMNVKKLHAFLSERNVKIKGGHSKPELLAQAKAIAMREQNCSTAADCECARNGVGCHANVCVGCAGDCHNPFDQYAYNRDRVVQYRKQMIAQWNEAHKLENAKEPHASVPQPKHAPICVA